MTLPATKPPASVPVTLLSGAARNCRHRASARQDVLAPCDAQGRARVRLARRLPRCGQDDSPAQYSGEQGGQEGSCDRQRHGGNQHRRRAGAFRRLAVSCRPHDPALPIRARAALSCVCRYGRPSCCKRKRNWCSCRTAASAAPSGKLADGLRTVRRLHVRVRRGALLSAAAATSLRASSRFLRIRRRSTALSLSPPALPTPPTPPAPSHSGEGAQQRLKREASRSLLCLSATACPRASKKRRWAPAMRVQARGRCGW